MSLFQAVVEEHGGQVFWGSDNESEGEIFMLSSTPTVQTVYMKDPCWKTFQAVGSRLSSPWINLFFQEDSFWEFSLRSGEESLDRFSVAPQEWKTDIDFIEARKGHPEILASVWAIPVERIVRYMVNWDPGMIWSDILQREAWGYRLKGKAYAEDEHSYGDVWQAADFIRALGGRYPDAISRIRLPK